MPRFKSKPYPWDKWLKKKSFTLTRGEHYHCMSHVMSVQVRNAAIARGLRVHVYIQGESLHVILRGKDA